jgi:hypothetical protein
MYLVPLHRPLNFCSKYKQILIPVPNLRATHSQVSSCNNDGFGFTKGRDMSCPNKHRTWTHRGYFIEPNMKSVSQNFCVFYGTLSITLEYETLPSATAVRSKTSHTYISVKHIFISPSTVFQCITLRDLFHWNCQIGIRTLVWISTSTYAPPRHSQNFNTLITFVEECQSWSWSLC